MEAKLVSSVESLEQEQEYSKQSVENPYVNHASCSHIDSQTNSFNLAEWGTSNFIDESMISSQSSSQMLYEYESEEFTDLFRMNKNCLKLHQAEIYDLGSEGETLRPDVVKMRKIPIHFHKGSHSHMTEDTGNLSRAFKDLNCQNSTPRSSSALSAESLLAFTPENESLAENRKGTKVTTYQGLTGTSLRTISSQRTPSRKTRLPTASYMTTTTIENVSSENDENTSLLNRTTGLVRPRASRNGITRKAATPTFTRKNSTPLQPALRSTVATLALSRQAIATDVMPRRKGGLSTLKTGLMTPRALPSSILTTSRIGQFLEDVSDMKVMVLVSLTSKIREVRLYRHAE